MGQGSSLESGSHLQSGKLDRRAKNRRLQGGGGGKKHQMKSREQSLEGICSKSSLSGGLGEI